MTKHTFFTGNKTLSALFWTTILSSVVISNILGAMNFNLSVFNPVSHFLFGFLSRELFKTANEYYPFIDKVAEKFPQRLKKYFTPTTFAFVLCMGNGIQEEIQKLIPGLRHFVWTSLPDQITDAVMDIGGITLSAKKELILARLKGRGADGD